MLYCGCSICGGSIPNDRAIHTASVICWADHSDVPPAVARPAGTSTAPFATVVNVQRVVRGWRARGLQRLASWRAAPPEEEV